MSNQFLKLRRSAVQGKIPETSSLDLGELAINTYDGQLFLKKSGSQGEIVTVVGSTGSFTGSFFGNGAGLSNIPASGITGLNLSRIATGSISASVNTDISSSFRLTSGSNTLLNVTRDGFVWIGNGTFSNQGYQLDVNGPFRATVGGNVLELRSNGFAYVTRMYFLGDYLYNSTNQPTLGIGNRMQMVSNTGIDFTWGNLVQGNFIFGTTVSTNNSVGGTKPSFIVSHTLNDGASSTLGEFRSVNITDVINMTSFPLSTYRALYIAPTIASLTTNVVAIQNVIGNNLFNTTSGSTGVGVSSINASAKLQIDSTTQGFLPTRTNSTASITSPAQGLLTYITASGDTEGLWQYRTGSNGWVQFLHNSSSIPASSIVGLNLSRIATGSVSASVGVGASSFSVVSGSSTFLYASSSGNIGVNTSSPTAKIHISGSGTDSLFRIQSPFSFNGVIQNNIVNVNGAGEVGIGATPFSQVPLYIYRSGYGELLRLGSDASTIGFGNGEIYIGSAANTKFSPGELRLINNSGNAIIRNSYVGGSSGLVLIAPANIILTPGTFDGSGNVGINTTSPTAKLDVSGSSRFGGNMVITGSGNTSATTALTVQNSDGTEIFRVRNNGAVLIASGILSVDAVQGYTSGHIRINRAIASQTTSTIQASAQFEVQSTTQGFLTPRMTEAQRLAIATPAQGLIVYDTGSATEGLWLYNSGSNPGWQEVLTNSGSQSISGSITANSITVTGTLTAQTIVAQTITSSTDFVTGSTRFGSLLSNTHQFTGSVSITGSLTLPYLSTGSVLFAGATDNITEDNTNLFWDNTNKRLGIGTNAPGSKLSVITSGGPNFIVSQGFGDVSTQSGYISVSKGRGSLSSPAALLSGDILGSINFGGYFTPSNIATAFAITAIASSDYTSLANPVNLVFRKFDTTANSTELMRLYGSTGNLAIGGTFVSDGGQRLQVYGDAFIKGSGNTSATTALTVQDSASSDMLRVRSDSKLLIGGASTTAAPSIYAFSGITGNRSLRIGIQSAGSLTPIPAFNINQENDYIYTTGTGEFATITANFLPTSGTGTLASLVIRNTINQQGGANGITRGLYVNPTLTAAADWRSIEWSNNSGWGLYGAGTAPNFLGGDLTINRNQNASTQLNVTNTNSGNNSAVAINVVSDSGQMNYGKYSSTKTAFKFLNATDGFLYNSTNSGDIAILNDFATGKIKFGAGGSSTAQMTLTAAGRLLLGTVSEETFRLDVNGTARISGSLTINNSQFNNTSSLTSAGITTVSQLSTSSYTSCFYNYTVASASNARSGQVMSVWNGSTLTYTEVVTTDIGNTSQVAVSSSLSGGLVRLQVSASSGWTFKNISNLL